MNTYQNKLNCTDAQDKSLPFQQIVNHVCALHMSQIYSYYLFTCVFGQLFIYAWLCIGSVLVIARKKWIHLRSTWASPYQLLLYMWIHVKYIRSLVQFLCDGQIYEQMQVMLIKNSMHFYPFILSLPFLTDLTTLRNE